VKTLVYILILSFSILGSSQSQNDRYIFFLHNRFLETHGIDELHPNYGRFEYKEMIQKFEKEDFVVISEQRRGNVNARVYANQIVNQIDSLIFQNTKPQHITIVGTSKGGYIAQYVSTLANNDNLNFVFIGCFRESDIEQIPEINFCGNILTIYEKSDLNGSSAIERKKSSTCNIKNFMEIELNTGLGHGFLFKPLDKWITPTIYWAKGDYKHF